MPYVTGSTNSIAGLLTAVQNACTANGWTLQGNVLSKGGCYVSLSVSGSTLALIGGTGIDGSNNLTGTSDQGNAYLGQSLALYNQAPVAFGWPVTYFVHIGTLPDEVHVVCNYGGTLYQTMAWGKSGMPGLVGSGNWYCGPSAGGSYGGVNSWIEYSLGGYAATGASFARLYSTGGMGVDHELDAATWALDGKSSTSFAGNELSGIMMCQPNQWNSESILFPIRAYAARPSGYYSMVLECAHARAVNLQNLNDQQIITLGTDNWKVYPWYMRSTSTGMNGQASNQGSGFCGTAIRYDGP